ncbi:MAG TPA: electron transfer flavoprotein subunit beta/FixA family protein [Bacillota bacterium]
MGLHVAVLIKQVLDPEVPASRFQIDDSAKRPAAGIAPEVLGPYEKNALEVALQLKDAGVAEQVTALTVDGQDAAESLRKALAVRADQAVLIDVSGHDELDPAQTAELVARAVQRLDSVDLVVAGRQAGDWDHGQVGYLVAERLGWPCVALVRRAEASGDVLRLTRQTPLGREVVEARPPLVVTVTNDERNVLRLPRVQDLMAARRRPITQWTPADLGLDAGTLANVAGGEVLGLRIPQREGECEFITGDEPAEVAAALVRRLKELKLL